MVPEQVIQIIVTDNLDVACAAIEKAAMERAVSDVDEGFTASYDARRRHREVCRPTYEVKIEVSPNTYS